jgi:hypothetical protein
MLGVKHVMHSSVSAEMGSGRDDRDGSKISGTWQRDRPERERLPIA